MKRALIQLGFVAVVVAGLAGCGGGGGGTAATTPPPSITPPPTTGVGPVTPTAEALAVAATANGEACSLCHNNSAYRGGQGHQDDYDQLYQANVMTVSGINFSWDAGTNTSTLTFTLMKNAVAFDCSTLTGTVGTVGSYWSAYDNAARRFQAATGSSYVSLKPGSSNGSIAGDAGTGLCTFTKQFDPATEANDITAVSNIAPNLVDGIIQVYGVNEIVEAIPAAHMNKGKYPFAGVRRYGPAMSAATAPYKSAANVKGCENCHTQPFLKHAYIKGTVDDLTGGSTDTTQEFYVCKGCHSNARDGHDQFWQLLKAAKDADPTTAAGKALRDHTAAVDAGTESLTADEQTKYAYQARLMNDVHMSHAMEFAYPQSMRNCVTCHEGKMGTGAGNIFNIANFEAETCISCHGLEGIQAKMTAANYNHAGIADTVTTLKATDCTKCHDGSTNAPKFETIHTGGYDPEIYASDGTRYSTNITVSIDSASFDSATSMLTVNFTASGTVGSLAATSITPTVMVGLYGYDTKDFIVAAHGRDSDGNRLLEFKLGDTNPRFTGTVNSPGNWTVTADLSAWASMLTDGTVKRAEIAVLPELKDASGAILGLNAPSKTFNFANNAFQTYFTDLVNVAKTPRTMVATPTYTGVAGCNTCHDQLATTFHSGTRGGNIRVCRLCHVKSSGGSHLEIQSRSIDSYVHAIHSFQAFDIGDIDFTDPFEAMEYRHHTETMFPRFGLGDGATDCESCHVAGSFEPANQSKSLPAIWSGTDTVNDPARTLPTEVSVVSGPSATACGGCHRAHKIVENDGGGLTTLYAHWSQFGYVKTTIDTLWDALVQKFH